MNKHTLILAVCLIGLGYRARETGAVDFAPSPLASGLSPSNSYYCPPGAKFCPAPGADNTVYLDTHFGVDAQTGEVIAYKGTEHPDDVVNPPMTGEKVLYVAPPISVENRYVPYPGAPAVNAGAGAGIPSRPEPVYSSRDMSLLAGTRSPARGAARQVAESEVANNQADRSPQEIQAANDSEKPWWKGGLWSRGDGISQGEEIPWWKGGLWRNREPRDSDGDASSSRDSRSAAADDSATESVDDIWDDYASNDSSSDPLARGEPFGNGGYSPDPFAGAAYSDGSATARSQQYDPYGQPASGGFVGDAYTLPDSPPPTSPYPTGYVYPGTNLSAADAYQPQPAFVQGAPVQQSPAMTAYAPQRSAFPPPPAAAPSGGTPFLSGANGGAQLENAKRMVKEDRFSEAKNLLLDETRANPRSAEAWRWLADCHYNLLELDDAVTTYQRALDNDPNDYYAMRGQGFSYLHRGHEYWRRMQEEVAGGNKEQAAYTFTQAHENYKKALDLLGFCLRRAPNDGEAIYGEAMAAEGASRKLYSNAVSYIKLGPEQRERAEVFAENCITVINKGIERSKEKAGISPGDIGPRALMGGLYLRKAILYNQLGKNDLALIELRSSREVQQSILDEIDKNNTIAQRNIQEAETLWNSWGGSR